MQMITRFDVDWPRYGYDEAALAELVEFTLRTMFYVSLLVPFVFAYIAYVWRVMDRK